MLVEEIHQPLAGIKGIGPKIQASLIAHGIRDAGMLLRYYPRDWEDRTKTSSFASALKSLRSLDTALQPPSERENDEAGMFNTQAQVIGHNWIGRGPRKILKIEIEDETASLSLVCFNRDFLARSLPIGAKVSVFGKAEYKFAELQSSNFDYRIGDDSDFHRILPIYPLSGDLSQGLLRKVIPAALSTYGMGISENLPPFILDRYGFPDKKTSIFAIHQVPNLEELERAKARLVYEELFFLQLELQLARTKRESAAEKSSSQRSEEKPKKPLLTSLPQRLLASLGFRLTKAQTRVLDEILADMLSGKPMARLIQGDVGSGKTILALLAALAVVETGGQAAIMVPTVLLARQHAEKAAALLEPLGVTVALHAGQLQKNRKLPLSEAIADGRAQIIIGTHGLFSEELRYANLRLAIIDEQHRFGVRQRQAFYQKSEHPHLLMMTATPIPQTLALTLFGDMDVSVLDEMPPGRLPIETHLTRMGNEEKTYAWVEKEINKGSQAYFVYPRIEEEGAGDMKSAELMSTKLAERFGKERVAIIHGKQSEEDKLASMQAFISGKLPILVATSVVEVGVDVPNATCMVIEHAERFGMAALHQLRGRVGRGVKQSFCFLVYSENLTSDGKARLMALKEHQDGFVLAEKDLEIRGPGDLAGTEQSGYLRLRMADLVRDAAIMAQARNDLREILAQDPELTAVENQGLKKTRLAHNLGMEEI